MKNKKIIYAVLSAWLVLGMGIYLFNYLSVKHNKANNIADEILTPESVDDIPPNIVDNVAPDLEQKFKAEAKDFHLTDINGNEVKLSDYKGKNVVLDFWASWCEPCLTEMPYIIDAMEKYDGQVEFLMINLADGEKETKESAMKYIEENNLNIVPLFDEHLDATINYNVTSLPRTIFIDKNGLIQKSVKGTLTPEYLETQIQNLLNLED